MVAEAIKDRDITHLGSSPLERAQETARRWPRRGLEIVTDQRVIESTNVFEGKRFGVGDSALRNPSTWRHLWNPLRPSWGEPYKEVVARMMAARRRRPRAAAPRPRGGHGLPPAADLDHPAGGREAARSCTTRASASARCAR